MPHIGDVAADVGMTIRHIIVQWTPYTLNHPSVDQNGFHFKLVPSAELWDGWRAEQRSWHVLLSKIVQSLHNLRPEYAALNVNVTDVTDTLDEPLALTRILLVEKIMTGIAEVSGVSVNAEGEP